MITTIYSKGAVALFFTFFISVSPKITVERSEVVIKMQSRVVLRCSAVGVPPPRIHWFKNQKKLNQSGRVRINGDGSLVINNPIAQDVGIYECVAVSSAGSTSGQIEIKLPSKKQRDIFTFLNNVCT